MKKVIIIILAVFLAIDIGAITYAATRGPSITFEGNAIGLKDAPEKSVYRSAADWYELDELINISDPAEKAASLLLYNTYNLIESTGFYVLYKTDIKAESGESSYSENFRAVQRTEEGANEIYQTLTSSSCFEKRQIKFYNEELLQKDFGAIYDEASGKFDVQLNGPSSTTGKSFSKKGKNTYVMRSWFDFPLYLGGKDNDKEEPGDLVWDSIDGSSVKVEDGSEYTTITFSVLLNKANDYEDQYHYLSYGSLGGDQTGGGSVNKIESMTFEVNIWKEGLFRDMTVTAEIDGELGGQKGKATVTKTYEFSYAAQDVSTAYWLSALNWFIFLKDGQDIIKYTQEKNELFN